MVVVGAVVGLFVVAAVKFNEGRKHGERNDVHKS